MCMANRRQIGVVYELVAVNMTRSCFVVDDHLRPVVLETQ